MTEKKLQINGQQVTRGEATIGALEFIDGQIHFVPEGDILSMAELAELIDFIEQENQGN